MLFEVAMNPDLREYVNKNGAKSPSPRKDDSHKQKKPVKYGQKHKIYL